MSPADHSEMRYAIIAAGEGARLAQEGVAEPKPLVRVAGEPLIDRLIRIFMAHQATEICVICRSQMPSVAHHLQQIQSDGLYGQTVPLRVLVKSTPSSMHSLYELSPWLAQGWFCATTVDTLFREEEFSDYIEALSTMARLSDGDGLMGVTGYIDDERPLYVGTDTTGAVTGFHDDRQPDSRWISAGIYGLSPRVIGTLCDCVKRGEQRMRSFQRAMVADGMRLRAFPFGRVFDIDHAADIDKAERWLSGQL